MTKVLDSSAVLAFLYNEPGAVKAGREMAGGRISAVNAAEVLAILARCGIPAADAQLALRKTQLQVVDFTLEHAALSVRFLSPRGRGRQISLGDRACMATGVQAGVPVVTADRGWAALQVNGLKVEVIR